MFPQESIGFNENLHLFNTWTLLFPHITPSKQCPFARCLLFHAIELLLQTHMLYLRIPTFEKMSLSKVQP